MPGFLPASRKFLCRPSFAIVGVTADSAVRGAGVGFGFGGGGATGVAGASAAWRKEVVSAIVAARMVFWIFIENLLCNQPPAPEGNKF